jgi:hypothetical protein
MAPGALTKVLTQGGEDQRLDLRGGQTQASRIGALGDQTA